MKAIKTRFLGPTNYRGSRIVATAEGGERDHRLIISADGDWNPLDPHQAAAKALCAKMGWHGRMITGALRDCYVHVFVTHKLDSGRDYELESFEV